MTKETSEATIVNSKMKCKRVKPKKGEILTTTEVLEQHENEHKDRQKNQVVANMRTNKIISDDKCEKDKSDDSEIDDTVCIACNQLWPTYKRKKSELWLICDTCDCYVCPKYSL